jgi:uncharacterized protein
MQDSLKIKQFFTSPSFAVIGASADRNKYGNKVLRCYLEHHKIVYPVNPNEQTIEGLSCTHDLQSLPQAVQSISIITPPTITEKIVEEAHKKDIQNIWMQPGAESALAIQKAESYGMNVIAGGPCILVVLGFQG